MSVTGFAASGVKDRTEYIGTDKYRTVSDEKEFLQALTDASKGKVKVNTPVQY